MARDVLLVEDASDLRASVAEYLGLSGLSVLAVGDAEAALGALDAEAFGVILLDIGLPGMSGLAACRAIRARSETPIVFLSARRSDDDQVLALALGGDDYLVKPFSLAVLLAKVRRILERGASTTPAGQPIFDDGRLRIDTAAGRVQLDGREVPLKPLEYRLLAYLVAHRGRVVEKAELFAEVWGDTFVGDGTLNVHVRRLRTKIEDDPAHPRYLRTVWGRGYLFEGARR